MSSIYLMGEEVEYNGAYKAQVCLMNLQKRVIDTPIAELGIYWYW
jgi:pyruvate/2-oxoglutarate/acetoin dehydrogenase E1 component